jgi:hypothetical protein
VRRRIGVLARPRKASSASRVHVAGAGLQAPSRRAERASSSASTPGQLRGLRTIRAYSIPGAEGDLRSEGLELEPGFLHSLGMSTERPIGRRQVKNGLARLLGHRHQASIVPQLAQTMGVCIDVDTGRNRVVPATSTLGSASFFSTASSTEHSLNICIFSEKRTVHDPPSHSPPVELSPSPAPDELEVSRRSSPNPGRHRALSRAASRLVDGPGKTGRSIQGCWAGANSNHRRSTTRSELSAVGASFQRPPTLDLRLSTRLLLSMMADSASVAAEPPHEIQY